MGQTDGGYGQSPSIACLLVDHDQQRAEGAKSRRGARAEQAQGEARLQPHALTFVVSLRPLAQAEPAGAGVPAMSPLPSPSSVTAPLTLLDC